MGAWGDGPFDNDMAADVLDQLADAPSRGVTSALKRITRSSREPYLEVDDGSAGWAACELVALSFGRGDFSSVPDQVLELVGKLRPNEQQRLLALDALPRIADRAASELAELWADEQPGSRGESSRLDVSLADLRERLTAAGEGALAFAKLKTGDVLLLSAPELPTGHAIVVQVVGAREVAVFQGTCASDGEALRTVERGSARRVLAGVARLLFRGRRIANVPVRRELRGRKHYAHSTLAIGEYGLLTATGAGSIEGATYEEARSHDLFELHDEAALRAIALGTRTPGVVDSPDEWESRMREGRGARWAERRAVTTPSPFGDVVAVEKLLEWIERCGLENAIGVLTPADRPMDRSNSPEEDFERSAYAFAAVVAIIGGRLSGELLPPELAARLPTLEDDELARATELARVLVRRVLRRGAELRMMWDAEPERAAELRAWVHRLQDALDS